MSIWTPQEPSDEVPHLNLYVDGASKGNPGMAGAGAWISNREGKKLLAVSRYLGCKTNNEAEYWALLIGLRQAQRFGRSSIRIFTDSELVAKQVKGTYRVREPNLKGLHRQVMEQLKAFSSVQIESISRQENQEADRLANEAIRRKMEAEKRKEGGRKGTDGRSSVRPA